MLRQANINNIKEGSVVQTAMGVQWMIVKLGSGELAIRRANLIIDLSGIVDARTGDLMGMELVE